MRGQDLVAGKLGRRGGHLALLFVQVFGGEDLGGRACLEKKAAALGGNDGRNGCRGHQGTFFSNCMEDITLISESAATGRAVKIRSRAITRYHDALQQ